MKTPFVTTCFSLWLGVVWGQAIPAGAPTTYSDSGQFIVYGVPNVSYAFRPRDLADNTNLIELDPSLLTISCERVKQALWRELGLTGPWSGGIYMVLHPAQSADESITITSERFADRWNYRVQLPDMVDRIRFLRALTQVLLLEIANRSPGTHPAEIPTWLREGFVQQWLTFEGAELVPPLPKKTVNGIKISTTIMVMHGFDPLKRAHAVLLASLPIAFEELSWPNNADFEGVRGERYRCAAQLFANQLLNLTDGRACMRAMLSALPRYYNWQFAFLHAFRAHFSRLIDVEKWWAVNLVQFVGRDPARTWPLAESLQKLEDTIRPPIQVRTATNELPMHADATLQTIIRDWKADQQTETLQRVIIKLQLLRLQVAPVVTPLADEYRLALESYLKRAEPDNSTLARRHPIATSRILLVRDTLKQLDTLDARRALLQAQATPVATAKNRPPPIPVP